MKRHFSKWMLVAVLSTAAAFAQRTPPDPATMIERKVSFLKALLSLTDAQVSQETTIATNALAAETPLKSSLSTARTSLRDAVKANNTATIDSLSTQIGTLTGQISAIESKAEAAFYALLTADQKTKYDALGGGHGPGDGHGPGPGFGRP